jgi:UDP-N-acetylglucosamine--N-acetylmuramyl-(pentapeptide) pyrophosphoryl-undecaprenol N-acetylglucosamine transferase
MTGVSNARRSPDRLFYAERIQGEMMPRSPDNPVILFAGGGTGGHLYPAIALATGIRNRCPEVEIHFAGTRKGLETRVIPELGYPLHLVAVRGFQRGQMLTYPLVVLKLLWSCVQSVVLVLRLRPDVVVGTGGYVSGPVLFVASLLRVPTLIQEQNNYPGITTRLLQRWVDEIHISFEETRDLFRVPDKVVLSGNPVRSLDCDLTRAQSCERFGLDSSLPVCLVFGGSQGARILNETVLDCVDSLLSETPVQLIWSTGPAAYPAIRERLESRTERIWLGPYIEEMAVAYTACDFAISRAGALTLAELTLCGIPALLIPLKTAAGNHQVHNARALERQNAVRVREEDELSSRVLLQEIRWMLEHPQERQAMASQAKAVAFPDATERLVDAVNRLGQIECPTEA